MELTHFETQRKAADAAYWYNFIHQYDDDFKPMCILHGADDDFVMLEEYQAKEIEIPFLEMPKDYSELNYPHMRSIKADLNPLTHWSEIFGSFAVLPIKYLRFILEAKVPLVQIAKYEMSARGLNKKGQWIGFDQAERLWFGSNHKPPFFN
jgi:hypothetical protein